MRAATGSDTFDLTLVAAVGPSAPLEPIIPAPGLAGGHRADGAGCAVDDVARRAGVASHRCAEFARRRGGEPASRLGGRGAPADPRTDCERTRDRSQVPGTGDPHAEAGRPRAPRRPTCAACRASSNTIKANDRALGELRPDAVASMIAAVEDQLDAARRLRLERDRWALRAPGLRAYRSAMTSSLDRLQQMVPLLEDIKSLAGSGPDAIGVILDGDGEDPESSRRRSNLRRSFATSTTSSPARCNSPTTRRRFGAKPR